MPAVGAVFLIPNSAVTQAHSEALEDKGNLIRALVDRGGVTKVVTGAYYAVGDSIRFQAEWVEVDRLRSLATIQPATEALEETEQTPRPERGSRALGRAAVAASLGESDRAVDYLREANSKGMPIHAIHWHYASFFWALRGHPGFQEFMRPKG